LKDTTYFSIYWM